ncbi:MAG: glycosyltransferase family 9 protein [Gemmatimonas sp.]
MITMRSPAKRVFAILANGLCAIAAPILLRGRRAPGKLPAAPRVLLVRCDHIGDATLAMTVITALREQLNASQLDVLAAPWTKELFASHPGVDQVISYATPWWLAARSASATKQRQAWQELPRAISTIRRGRYDIGIDLRGDLRQILFFLVLGGCTERVSTDRTGGTALLTRTQRFDPTLHELAKNRQVVAELGVLPTTASINIAPRLPPDLERELELAQGQNGLVALATQGNQPSRAYPLAPAAELARLLTEELGVGVVYVGGPGERSLGETIAQTPGAHVLNLAGRTSLPETLGVLARTRAIITVDSGPMHLASLVGTPVIGLFGAGDPVQFGPWSLQQAVVTPPDGCRCKLAPICHLTSDGRGACMNSIAPAAVVAALAKLLPDSFPAPLCNPA